MEMIRPSHELLLEMNQLHNFHLNKSPEYNLVVKSLFDSLDYARAIEDLPFLPITLFKEMRLKSMPDTEVYRILNSSGTEGSPSVIMLNKENVKLQTSTLQLLFKERFGSRRLPMIIFDSKSILKSSLNSNARKAAIVGFSSFASERIFALDEDSNVNWELVEDFVQRFASERILVFGFTYMLWESLVIRNPDQRTLDIQKGVLLHGGGWKKMLDLEISRDEFRQSLSRLTQVQEIVDYYGMAEQAGSVFFECSSGFFHSSNFSTVIIRDFSTLLPNKFGEKGLVQVLSTLPRSYPGHSLLTQDVGTIFGDGDCPCGKIGRYFTIDGRLPKSQVRGCSDV